MGPLWEPELPGGASAGAALGIRLGDLEDREPLHWEKEVIASAQQLSSAGRRDQGRSERTAMASERTLSYKGAGRREEGGARPDAGKRVSPAIRFLEDYFYRPTEWLSRYRCLPPSLIT